MSEPAHQLVQVPAILTLAYADLLKMVAQPVYLTLEEAAEYARVSLSTIQRAARRPEDHLRWLKVVGEFGEFRRTKREWVDEWLERCAQEESDE